LERKPAFVTRACVASTSPGEEHSKARTMRCPRGSVQSGSSLTPTPTASPSPTPAAALVAKVATDAKLGKILVDETTGKTLYTWAKDTDEKSQCYDQCATFWPPDLTTANTVAAEGVTTGKFGTSARRDGALQVTFNGHPLYLYARDAAPGDTNGQGNTNFGAVWLVVNIPVTAIRRA
jgi:predicted lipoprotein with Yx(FWY)xxD motif